MTAFGRHHLSYHARPAGCRDDGVALAEQLLAEVDARAIVVVRAARILGEDPIPAPPTT
jgi:hypothetical protein